MADSQKEIKTTYLVKLYSGHIVPSNYIAFVLNKWLKSFRFGNDYIKLTDSDSYYHAYQKYIARILETPGTYVRLAVLSDDNDVALGFSVTTGPVLHYVYVGKDYRMQGIGKRLVPIEIIEFTHLTKQGLRLWAVKAPMAKFKPF